MFELVSEVQPTAVPTSKLYKWRSNKTGMQAVLIQRKSPSVEALLAVASEANDNAGCPHTLEHIVFMGSKNYPYKGLLDKVTAKQLSTINAYTAQDQTTYTITTAGYEGFLTALPVFLDMILHATVEDSACDTEVYHIDGNGDEKGVVFCEMQGSENTWDTVLSTQAKKMLYNQDSGYATNTGGCLPALRELTPDTIRQYHRDVYRPDNLSVVVSGDMEPEQLLEVLQKFDSELPETTKKMSRPFVDSKLSNAPSPLTKDEYAVIEFPDSSESMGNILISWLGPGIKDDVGCTAFEILRKYLAMSDAGKLEGKFVAVDKHDALASDVYGYTTSYLRAEMQLWFCGVSVKYVDSACQKIVDYLEHELLGQLDFNFLQQCVDIVYDSFVLKAEDDWETLGSLAVTEFLYGDDTTFEPWLGSVKEFDVLHQWSENEWRSFIQKFVVDAPKASVFAKPSREAAAKVESDKKARKEEILASRDLATDKKKLDDAMEKNEQPVPDDLLDAFPAPDFSKIKFFTSETAATDKLQRNLPGSPLDIDTKLQTFLSLDKINGLALDFEQMKSQFVGISLYFTMQNIEPRLYPLIDPVLSLAFSVPMKLDDGTMLSSDEVVQAVKQDLVGSSIIIDGQMQELVSVNVKARAGKYYRALEWVSRLMFNTIFDEKYVSIFIARHLKGLSEYKRSDSTLLHSAIEEILLNDKSLRRQVDPLISEKLVKEYEKNIPRAVADVQLLVNQLFRKENIRGVITGDFLNMQGIDFVQPWITMANRLKGDANTLNPALKSSAFLTDVGLRPSREALLTLSASTDSTSLKSITTGIKEYGAPVLVGLTVVNTFLKELEGPFGIAVRGPGLAYDARTSSSVQMGTIECSISESSDVLAAFKACRDTANQIVDGTFSLTDNNVSEAIAMVISNLAMLLGDPSSAAHEKFLDTVVKGYEPKYVYKLIDGVQQMTREKFIELVKTYILPVFDPISSHVFVVSPVSEEETIKTGFSELGYNVTVREVKVDSDDEEDSDEDSDKDIDEDTEESEDEIDDAE